LYYFQDNLKVAEQKELVVDENYLSSLGFVAKPALYPDAFWKNATLPVVVTYVLDDDHSQAIGLVMCAAKYLPNHTILVYNLGISDYKLLLVRHYIAEYWNLLEFYLFCHFGKLIRLFSDAFILQQQHSLYDCRFWFIKISVTCQPFAH